MIEIRARETEGSEIQPPVILTQANYPWRRRCAGRIVFTIDPGVLAGKPVFKGTRLAVEFIVDLLAQGWTEAQILESYPGIAGEDIRACLQYASEILKSERVFPISARS